MNSANITWDGNRARGNGLKSGQLGFRVASSSDIVFKNDIARGNGVNVKHRGPYTRIWHFLADSGCRDRALLVLGSNTAKQAKLTALLDPSTHSRPPLTHTSHHRPALVDLSRFIAVSGVTHSRFRRFSMCVSAVSGVSLVLVGVSLMSADVAVAVVRPDVISQRVLIPRGRTKAQWKALVEAHTIVQ